MSATETGLQGAATMPRGACVIRYEGAAVWRIKYLDAEGHQVQETVGREADGWTRRKAERALGAKLDAVTRGHRKPKRRTFSDLIDEFDAVALPAKPRKNPTLVDYRCTIRLHLRPALGHFDLKKLSRSPEEFERYAGDKIASGLSPEDQGPQPPRPRRTHVQDGSAVAVGVGEPAQARRAPLDARPRNRDAHGR